MQVHFTIALQFYVNVNVELYVHTLMYWRKKKAKLKELSNNISDRSEAKGTGIMSDLLLVNGEARQLVANPHYTILLTQFLTTENPYLPGLSASLGPD